MIKGIIIDKEDYDILVRKIEFYENECKIHINMKGFEGHWQYLPYGDANFAVTILPGEDVPQEFIDKLKVSSKKKYLILIRK